MRDRVVDTARLRVAFHSQLARKRIAGCAELTATRLAGANQPQRQRKRVQALLAKSADELLHLAGMRNRRKRKRSAAWLSRIEPGLSVNMKQALCSIVVGRQRVVINRPGGRYTVEVLDALKILPPEAKQRAAPESRVAAHAVVRVGQKRPPL